LIAGIGRWLPRVDVPWAPLGTWPTPLEHARGDVWVKREGASSPRYGGNKVRTLEAWLGHAQALGARRIWAIGAYGSNHVVATVVHARALGVEAAAILFPQPPSKWAAENAGALLASGCEIVRLPSVALVPFAGFAKARRELVMPPGGATPIGTLGAMSAAFELAEQIEAGLAPPPARIVLAVGSTCTTAGLYAGLALARAAGLWRWPLPIVHAVRVTPWPVTSRLVITQLAARSLARIARLGGPAATLDRSRLVVDARELGRGYGRITDRARAALGSLPVRLDGVYSAKAAAALARLTGPTIFWATKSEVVLPAPPLDTLRTAAPALATWLRT
jgi:D-cysteine desulfhydrase